MIVLTKMRVQKGLSKAKLARLADINASTLGQIEAGIFRPYAKQLQRLAIALNIPVKNAHRLLETSTEDEI